MNFKSSIVRKHKSIQRGVGSERHPLGPTSGSVNGAGTGDSVSGPRISVMTLAEVQLCLALQPLRTASGCWCDQCWLSLSTNCLVSHLHEGCWPLRPLCWGKWYCPLEVTVWFLPKVVTVANISGGGCGRRMEERSITASGGANG